MLLRSISESLKKTPGGAPGEEKKVEYIELIYDLIFVYLIGRNNSLLHYLEDGFISPSLFGTYVLTTLAVLQIWYYTTLYINRYCKNDVLEYLCIFVNMYLLYYMADGTNPNWEAFYLRYNIAWGLINLNLALQYFLRLKMQGGNAPWEEAHIKAHIKIILTQAAIIFASIPIFLKTGLPLSPLSILFGMVSGILSRRSNMLVSVDFAHLTERVMLYVVFTFGEMIIAISGYFGGENALNLSTVYFSLMSFLIVVGLFMCYGYNYDHIIDREMANNGNLYMLLHIFLITALSLITTGLEFMPEHEVAVIPKNIFIVSAFILYFVFLFLTWIFSKARGTMNIRFFPKLIILSIAFVILSALSYRNGYISIFVSAAYVWSVYWLVYRFGQINRAALD